MRSRLIFLIPAAILITGGISFGALYLKRYLEGTWAPTSFEGGLTFSDPPEIIDNRRRVLPVNLTSEFIEICNRLRTTTRSIGEDQGEGFVRLRNPRTANTNFLTLYPSKGVVFHGWWIDARTYEMMDRRAPCFELSDEFIRFIEAHNLKSTNAEQAGTGQPATRSESKSDGSEKPQPEAEGRSR